jgi:D-3-phosphoglycerate dehydrogenase / 2-oxoglutarate reductase
MTRQVIVVLDDWNSVCERVDQIRSLGRMHDVRVYKDMTGGADEIVARLVSADIVVLFRERTALTRDVLRALPRLRLIAQTGAGVAHIDVDTAREMGVLIATTPGASAHAVAEHTIGLMLSVYHRIAEASAALHDGGWPRIVGHEVNQKTLGILGYGRIGSLVGGIGAALGMKVAAWSRTTHPPAGVSVVETMTELFELSDCVSVHLRLTEESREIVNSALLDAQPAGGVFVNTARGGLVVEADLIEALASGHLIGAGLDVYSDEPLPTDSALRRMSNVTLTPHIGWTTIETEERFVRASVSNIEAFLAS